MTQIGQTPQLQPGLIQNSQPQPSSNQQKPVRQEAQSRGNTGGQDVDTNTNFQKLAEDILAKRASGEAVQRPAVERGQVLDIVV